MAWRYTEYAGCQCFTDWINKDYRLGIVLDEDTIAINPVQVKTPSGQKVNSLDFITNGRLRPRFYYRIGKNSTSVLNAELDMLGGFIRRTWSLSPETVRLRGFPGDMQKLETQLVDHGTYDDFRKFGEYAVSRLQQIAKEIILPPTSFQEHIPDDEMQEIERYHPNLEFVPNWTATQEQLGRDFADLFTIYTIFRVAKPDERPGLVKREDGFDKEQLQILHRLVESLL
ncbi:MAG: hypothetical protein PHF67_00580 [Candidatus Nanoarchaeia archaeon]|nr:hypothetical protein [Candidatus Nanoarchaeia archaeon]